VDALVAGESEIAATPLAIKREFCRLSHNRPLIARFRHDWLAHSMKTASSHLLRIASSLLVLVGAVLAVLILYQSFTSPLTEDGSKYVSAAATGFAVAAMIITVGAVLPRIASFKMAGAEVVLTSSDGKGFAEQFNKMTAELAAVRAPVSTLEGSSAPERLIAQDGLTTARPFASETFLGSDPEDPRKGMFGGRSAGDGFLLSARFPTQDGSRFVWIELAVARLDSLPMDVPVTFFLHTSFVEPTIRVVPSGGTIKLDVVAWGGFTVGAIVENSQETRLELDLARVRGAPKAIREL
jgi:hypothetical protein